MSRFTEAGAAAMARNINMNNLLSTWVYLDDKDTSQNVIYVSAQWIPKMFKQILTTTG